MTNTVPPTLNRYILGARQSNVASHGPELVKLYIFLLARYAGRCEEQLRQSAIAYGLKL